MWICKRRWQEKMWRGGGDCVCIAQSPRVRWSWLRHIYPSVRGDGRVGNTNTNEYGIVKRWFASIISNCCASLFSPTPRFPWRIKTVLFPPPASFKVSSFNNYESISHCASDVSFISTSCCWYILHTCTDRRTEKRSTFLENGTQTSTTPRTMAML